MKNALKRTSCSLEDVAALVLLIRGRAKIRTKREKTLKRGSICL